MSPELSFGFFIINPFVKLMKRLKNYGDLLEKKTVYLLVNIFTKAIVYSYQQ
jgi:hypothetical protein